MVWSQWRCFSASKTTDCLYRGARRGGIYLDGVYYVFLLSLASFLLLNNHALFTRSLLHVFLPMLLDAHRRQDQPRRRFTEQGSLILTVSLGWFANVVRVATASHTCSCQTQCNVCEYCFIGWHLRVVQATSSAAIGYMRRAQCARCAHLAHFGHGAHLASLTLPLPSCILYLSSATLAHRLTSLIIVAIHRS